MKILQLLFFALALLILGVSCSNTKWKCVKGYSAPMRLKDGEVQCMGNKMKKSNNCFWKGKCTRLKLSRARFRTPFSCSGIGYEDQNHWCTKVKNILDPKLPSEGGGIPVPDDPKPKPESTDAGSETGGEGTDASGVEGNKIKQKAKWQCVKGYSAPMRLKDGEVQCMGNKMRKSNNCFWKGKCTRLKLLRARFRTPFSCSGIGYEDQNHWCTKVKKILDPSLTDEPKVPVDPNAGSETGGAGTTPAGDGSETGGEGTTPGGAGSETGGESTTPATAGSETGAESTTPATAGSETGGEGTTPGGAGSETGGEGTTSGGAGSETGGEGTEPVGAEGNALNDEYAHDQIRTQDAQLSSSSSIAMIAGVAVFAGLIVIAIIVGAVIVVVKNRSSGMGDYYSR